MANAFRPTFDAPLSSTLGAFDAKTHFSKILEMVGKGKEFVVTKHGRPVAKISPVHEASTDSAHALYEKRLAVIAEIKANRFTLAKGQTIRSLIEDGRRY